MLIHRTVRFALTLLFVSTAGASLAQSGFVQVRAQPGIQVFLDDVFVGVTNSDVGGLILTDVRTGTRRLRFVRDGFLPQDATVNVVAGQVLLYEVGSLVPRVQVREEGAGGAAEMRVETGSLVVQCLPIECVVDIPALGITNRRKTQDRLVVEGVPVGVYAGRLSVGATTLPVSFGVCKDDTVSLFGTFIGSSPGVRVTSERELGPDCQQPLLGIAITPLAGVPGDVRGALGFPESGLVVIAVVPSSAAEAAGIVGPATFADVDGVSYPTGGDVIVSADGAPTLHLEDLQRVVIAKAAGDAVTLEVWRDGHTRSVEVTLADVATGAPFTPADLDPFASADAGGVSACRRNRASADLATPSDRGFPWDFDPRSTRALTLPVNTELRSEFLEGIPIHRYELVEAAPGMVVEIEMVTEDWGLDTFLYVFDVADGTVLFHNDDAPGTDRSFIAFVAEPFVTYHVLATSWSGADVGAYRLSVRACE